MKSLNGQFGLEIPQRTRETPDGHIGMRHNTDYALRLINYNPELRCDAIVSIDGEEIATFRLRAGETWDIESHPKAGRKLCFYKLGTPEGEKAALEVVSRDLLGVINVVYISEKARRPVYRGGGGGQMRSLHMFGELGATRGGGGHPESFSTTKGLSAGGTGLSGVSGQKFHNAEEIERDETTRQEINLRLVSDDTAAPTGPSPLPKRIATSVPGAL